MADMVVVDKVRYRRRHAERRGLLVAKVEREPTKGGRGGKETEAEK